jgi:glycosyltransferase involved in cell wall biosynthesis
MKRAIFTICAKNYLARARTLFDSSVAHEPEVDRFLILADRAEGALDQEALDFTVIEAESLEIDDFEDLTIRYDITELSTAIKAAAFLHLLARYDHDQIVYLDPDIWIISSLEELWQSLDSGANAVLTPHTTTPIEDGDEPDDQSMLKVGVYNLGFIAIRRGPETTSFLEWWHRRLLRDCRIDLAEGLFVDQKWADLLPCFVENTHILRHPGYNVAYWNLMNRAVTSLDGRWHANGEALRFVHFSGLDMRHEPTFSKHQQRFHLYNIGELRQLVDAYREAVSANDQDRYSGLAYAFDCFGDEEPLPEVLRRMYREDFDSERVSPTRRLEALTERCNEPSPELSHHPDMTITRLMHRVWQARDDLGSAFDLREIDGRLAYCAWWAYSASRELGLSERFVPAPPPPAARPTDSTAAPHEGPRAHAGPKRRLGARLALLLLTNAYRARSLYLRIPISWRQRFKTRLLRIGYTTRRPANLPEATDSSHHQPGAQLVGYPRAELGMGEHVRLSATALDSVKFPFSIYDFSTNVVARQQDDRFVHFLSTETPYSTNIFHINADQMPVAYDALGSAFFEGRYSIGYWAWELPEFPDAWLTSIDMVNEIWAPSRFIRDAIARKTDKPVVWMPLAVDVQPLPSLDRTYFHLPEDKFVFLFSFDFASFATRKNPWAVLDAFEQAFERGDERVHLVVKAMHLPEHNEQVEALEERVAKDSRIRLISQVLSHREIAGLANRIDCYVSLHRSEGFGRGMAEAMHLGKPVIATGYSGNMDFMSEDSACLVDYSIVPVKEGEYPHHEGQVWADPDIEQAASYMRRLVDEPAYGRELGRRARRRLTSEFSPSHAGRRMKDRLIELGLA